MSTTLKDIDHADNDPTPPYTTCSHAKEWLVLWDNDPSHREPEIRSMFPELSIRFGPFPVTFDRALTYRNAKLKMPFVLAAPDSADPINGLRFQLGRKHSRLIGSIGYRQRPIQPHVTLVWDQISVPENSIEPLTIIVQEFALVRSHIGFGKYDILNR